MGENYSSSRDHDLAASGSSDDWRPIASAPRDGTVVDAVARYRDARAGFPCYLFWMEGAWREPGRTIGEPMVAWAWRPRTDWPAEPQINIEAELESSVGMEQPR